MGRYPEKKYYILRTGMLFIQINPGCHICVYTYDMPQAIVPCERY